jgi:hypothetical protein
LDLTEEVSGWIRAFAFTQTVEIPLYLLAFAWPRLRGRFPDGRLRPPMGLPFRFAVAFLCSLLTHPVVWFGFPRLIEGLEHYAWMVVAAETFAVTSEALILWAVRLRFALLVAFLVNMTSMSLGFLLRYVTHWI